MTPAERYRAMAVQMDAKAREEPIPTLRLEWETLARCYRRLSEQADHNAQTDVVYEPPSERK